MLNKTRLTSIIDTGPSKDIVSLFTNVKGAIDKAYNLKVRTPTLNSKKWLAISSHSHSNFRVPLLRTVLVNKWLLST